MTAFFVVVVVLSGFYLLACKKQNEWKISFASASNELQWTLVLFAMLVFHSLAIVCLNTNLLWLISFYFRIHRIFYVVPFQWAGSIYSPYKPTPISIVWWIGNGTTISSQAKNDCVLRITCKWNAYMLCEKLMNDNLFVSKRTCSSTYLACCITTVTFHRQLIRIVFLDLDINVNSIESSSK